VQDGHANPLSTRGIYVGFGANVMSIGPATAVQWLVHSIASRQLGTDSLAASASAGFVAGVLIAGPTEQGMTVQQNHAVRDPKVSFLRANMAHGLRRMVDGGVATGIRDGFFTLGMFYGAPAIAARTDRWCEDREVSPLIRVWLPRAVGGSSAGAVAAVVSQPFGTIAQKQRGRSEPMSVVRAARLIARDGGAGAFWAGGLARACRASIALVTIPAIGDGVMALFEKKDSAN
jgi:hypothetical protein